MEGDRESDLIIGDGNEAMDLFLRKKFEFGVIIQRCIENVLQSIEKNGLI